MLLRQPKLEEKMLSICRSSMLSAVSSMLTAAACCRENQNLKKNDNHQFYIPLRNCIYFTGYDAQYLSSPGGLDVVEVYFQNDLALNLEALQPLRRGTLEHQHLLSETLDRAEKYANR